MAAPMQYEPTGNFFDFTSWPDAANHILCGGLVLAESDSVPAVIGDPFNRAVISALDALLEHGSTEYSVNVSSVEMAAKYVDMSAGDERILRAVHNPVTLVARVHRSWDLQQLSRSLHADGIHLGLRVSTSTAEQALQREIGHPLTTTAVRRGPFLARTIDEAVDVLKLAMGATGVRRDVIVVRPPRRRLGPVDHSTVVRVQRVGIEPSTAIILRPGMASEGEIHRAISTVWGPWNLGDVT